MNAVTPEELEVLERYGCVTRRQIEEWEALHVSPGWARNAAVYWRLGTLPTWTNLLREAERDRA